jgi:hypothetical protein
MAEHNITVECHVPYFVTTKMAVPKLGDGSVGRDDKRRNGTLLMPSTAST